MQYVAVLKTRETELRFFNSLTSEDTFLPLEGVSFIHEGEADTQKEIPKLKSMGLVNDGLVPIMFDPSVSLLDFTTVIEGNRGNALIESLLMASGFCVRILKKRAASGNTDAVKERIACLLQESKKHFSLLSRFKERESLRESLFETPASLMAAWIKLQKSASALDKMSSDLRTVVGTESELG